MNRRGLILAERTLVIDGLNRSCDGTPRTSSSDNRSCGGTCGTLAAWQAKSYDYRLVVNGDVTLVLKNAEITRARVLDANGMPLREVPLAASADRKTLSSPPTHCMSCCSQQWGNNSVQG